MLSSYCEYVCFTEKNGIVAILDLGVDYKYDSLTFR